MRTRRLAPLLALTGLTLAAQPIPNQKTAFAPVPFASTAQYLYEVAQVADFNGDGKPDLLGLGQSDQYFSVSLGNGDGTFQSPRAFMPCSGGGCQVEAVAAGDFNHDGCLDVVSAINGNGAPSLITVVLGNCSGSFGAVQSYPAADILPYGIQVADFNGDGNLDVAIFCASANTTFLEVLLGNGDGTFQPPHNFPLQLPGIARSTVADFNGDGIPDLAFAANGNVGLLFGNGDGSFSSPVTVASLTSSDSLVTADFNKDGVPDLAVDQGATVAILLGKGGGTFATPVSYRTAGGFGYLIAGDFNGDGHTDLIAAHRQIAFLAGNGDGTFVEPPSRSPKLSLNQFPPSAAGDFNGDGRLDLASAGVIYVQSAAELSTYNQMFPTTLLGKTSTAETLTITNVGTGPLTISRITFTGSDAGDFLVATNTCQGAPVALGATCSLALRFKPAAAGYRTAAIAISLDGVPSPISVNLAGGATVVTLTPGKLDFGNVKVRTVSAAQQVTVTNTTDASIQVDEALIGGKDRGDFYVKNKSCQLDAHASCQFSVEFVPTAKGPRTATFRVDVNFQESKTVVLSGTGM